MGQLAGVAQITASLPTSEAIAPSKAGWRARWCAARPEWSACCRGARAPPRESKAQAHAGCFAKGIDLLRYPERLYCGIDAAWRDNDLLDREGRLTSARPARRFSAASASLPAATSPARP